MKDAPLPPFLVSAKTQKERRYLARLRKEGRIRPIGPRLFTSLPEERVEEAARGAWASIVSELHPGALVSHRTALEYVPDARGSVFLTSSTNRRVSYPGLELEFIRGPGPLSDDQKFVGLRASSVPRALLENLMHDSRTSVERSVGTVALERRLEQLFRDGGSSELNRIRDRAREIANELGWHAEFARLDDLIGALFGTRSIDHLRSSAARARALGEPFDTRCLERLQILFGELRTRALRTTSEARDSPHHFKNKAFLESYFSNYIEGTTFEIEEAEAIIFDKKIPAERPIDAHDIVGTNRIVSDPSEMRHTPETADALLELLRSRHATLLERRPDAQPGQFKTKPNRAGETHFVLPEYVEGTLRKGHALYLDLEPGIARAVFMMFLVSEVHPFVDGNGRIARIMMNSELVAARGVTIIIPTVFREDYLNALRAMTRRHRPAPLVDALVKAASFSNLDFASYPDVLAEILRRNWFESPDDAKVIVRD
jgi:hypothetical protein